MLPKSALKYSESQQQPSAHFRTDAPAPHFAETDDTVISCPQCFTSFAVESTLVASSANPRFHCSRCDSIFSLAEASGARSAKSSPLPLDDIASPSLETSTGRLPSSTKTIEVSRSHHNQRTVRASDFSLGSRTQPAARSSVANHEDSNHATARPNARATVAAEHTLATSGISLLNRAERSEHYSYDYADDTDLGTDPDTDYSSALLSNTFDTPEEMESFEQDAMSLPEETLDNQEISASVTNRLFSGGFEIGLPQAPKRTPRETQPATAMRIPAAPTPELRRQPAVTPPPLPQPAQTIDEETFQAALEAQGGLLSRAWNYLSVRNRSLVIASTPLVAVLVSLVSITPLASISPESIGSLMEALSPSMISQPVAHLPPSSLAIKQASIKFTKTSSQERLALISGVLVNTSNTTLSGVTLEGLVFNRRGEIVGSSQAPLRSALAKENVAELSLATVKKFQGSLNARSASIAAGESVPFTIALLNEPNTSDEGGTEAIKLRKIKYFSARVFSVN